MPMNANLIVSRSHEEILIVGNDNGMIQWERRTQKKILSSLPFKSLKNLTPRPVPEYVN